MLVCSIIFVYIHLYSLIHNLYCISTELVLLLVVDNDTEKRIWIQRNRNRSVEAFSPNSLVWYGHILSNSNSFLYKSKKMHSSRSHCEN